MCEMLARFFNNYYTAQQACTGENSCSHICAVIGGMEKCFCPVGLEIAVGSTTNCVGMKTKQVLLTNKYYYAQLLSANNAYHAN